MTLRPDPGEEPSIAPTPERPMGISPIWRGLVWGINDPSRRSARRQTLVAFAAIMATAMILTVIEPTGREPLGRIGRVGIFVAFDVGLLFGLVECIRAIGKVRRITDPDSDVPVLMVLATLRAGLVAFFIVVITFLGIAVALFPPRAAG